MVYKWQHARGKINQADKKAIKPGAGRKTLHAELEQQVHDQAMQARREGICVTLAGIAQSMRMAVQDPFFKASSGWIKGYKKRHPCKLRVPTVMIPASKWEDSTATERVSSSDAEKIKSFFEYKRGLEAKHSYSSDRIINMDETPVYFNNPTRRTLHYGSSKEPVAVKVMEGNQRARVTVMLTCTENGRLLKPCIVEASKSKAACTDAGSTRYEREGGVSCWKQENNTVNSSIMVDWIDNWLAPMYSWRAKGERVMLIMDSFRGHKTTEVKEACKRHDIDICMIPGGCTKYLQPLDLTVNRSYKCRLKDGYARMMKKYTGVIDKSRKESASKINLIALTANVIQAAKAVSCN